MFRDTQSDDWSRNSAVELQTHSGSCAQPWIDQRICRMCAVQFSFVQRSNTCNYVNKREKRYFSKKQKQKHRAGGSSGGLGVVLRMYLGKNLTVLSLCITQMNCYPQRLHRPCLVLNNSACSQLQTRAVCSSRLALPSLCPFLCFKRHITQRNDVVETVAHVVCILPWLSSLAQGCGYGMTVPRQTLWDTFILFHLL